MPLSSSGLLLYAATVDLLAEDFLSEEAQHTLTKKDKITAFSYVLLGGMCHAKPRHLRAKLTFIFSYGHVYRWWLCLKAHFLQCRSERSHFEALRNNRTWLHYKRQAPTSAELRPIAQDRWARPAHGHQKWEGMHAPDGTTADQAGNNQSLVFTRICTSASYGFGFFLCFREQPNGTVF